MINYLAVLVSAIGAFAVGALWYGPLFGRSWRTLMNIPDSSMTGGIAGMWKTMLGGFIATLLMVYVLAMFMTSRVGFFGDTDIQEALMFGFWVWLGFIATVLLNSVLYEKRPIQLYLINAAHYFVAILVAALILALFGIEPVPIVY